MNIVFMITDTVCKYMVGAYGRPEFKTPCIDKLASEGIRFERAYTACPVCTPARGAIFTGLQPASNGAWTNDQAPHRNVRMMGDIIREQGVRAPYTGKWHLDGSDYNGTGIPDGGFEPDWWMDRANLLAELPENIRSLYNMRTTADDLRKAEVQNKHIYGHRVADKAIEFLESANDDPFVLCVSFDEPHDPWISPPEYWEMFDRDSFEARPNYNAPLEGKPFLQHKHAQGIVRSHGYMTWQDMVAKRLKFFGSNSYIDSQVGRVVDAVDRLHADDTIVIYTSDHGDQLGSHGLHDKGPYMYEETTNVPFIVRTPGGPRGVVSNSVVSQIDLLPTFLDYIGAEKDKALHGVSLKPVFEDPDASVRETAMISFNRFMRTRNGSGGHWPIRAMTDGRFKLVINLHDSDELYDLANDPYEMTNEIENPYHANRRNELHDQLISEMLRTEDPMWNWYFNDRPWRPCDHDYFIPPDQSPGA